MRARRLAVLLLLLALPFAAAACGGGKKSSQTTTTSSATPTDAVKAAAEKTAKAGSLKLTLNVGGATTSAKLAVAGAGGFDTTNREGQLHLRFSTGGISGTMNVVLKGTDLYVSSPLLSLALPSGKTWIKVDISKPAKAGGLDLSTILSQDPTQALDALQNASTVTEVGTLQIGGATWTHYHALVSKSAAAKAGGTYDVWVGDDGYIHRVRTVVAGTAGSTTGAVRATSTLSGFGEPVTVTTPPASQTVTSNGSIPGLGG
jgi:hypothetical protein